MENTDLAAAPSDRTDRMARGGTAWRVLGEIMVVVGATTTAILVGLVALGFLTTHLVVADDGRVLYCDRVGLIFHDSFDDQGRWLKGWHEYTCDGRSVRTEEFTSEAADLGLPD
jgi:hypothetical protein